MATAKKPSLIANHRGFTLLEVLIVIATMTVMASIAVVNYIPLKRKAYDATARSDARSLVDSVVNATLSAEDVNYVKVNTGGDVGNVDTSGNPRNPVFTLSPGIEVVIVGKSDFFPGNQAFFSAVVYHVNGTSDPLTASGKKEYTCTVNESTGLVSMP